MSEGRPPRRGDFRLVTCIMPAGRGTAVLERLKREKKVLNASVHHARGVGTHSLHHRSMFFEEKQLLIALVEAQRADEIFEFLYYAAGIDEPHAGMVFIERAFRAAPVALPDGLSDED